MEPIANALRGTFETLLVVDDDSSVLRTVVAILEQANFRVFSAQSGADAIKLAEETELKIDLLLSDVDMPHMSGPDLATALKQTRPGIRVMLMSGGDNGLLVLNYGWAYLQKPFLSVKLVEMVTDVLHSEDRSQPGHQFDTRKSIPHLATPRKTRQ
jgi:two-component system, cell cycle sensor histidine kinase and response regulator CckA